MTDPVFAVPVKMKTIGSQRRYDGLLAALKVEPATRQELQDKIFASKTGTIELAPGEALDSRRIGNYSSVSGSGSTDGIW